MRTLIEQLVCDNKRSKKEERVKNWNPEVVEFDELGKDGGDFGTRVIRDTEEGAELTGGFARLGFGDTDDFGDGF